MMDGWVGGWMASRRRAVTASEDDARGWPGDVDVVVDAGGGARARVR
jgi:hypothetical protein